MRTSSRTPRAKTATLVRAAAPPRAAGPAAAERRQIPLGRATLLRLACIVPAPLVPAAIGYLADLCHPNWPLEGWLPPGAEQVDRRHGPYTLDDLGAILRRRTALRAERALRAARKVR